MKKKRGFIILLFLTVLSVPAGSLTGCAGQEEQEEQNTEVSTDGQAPDTETLTGLAEGYRDIYEDALQADTVNTTAVKQQIILRLGQSGYPVCDSENLVNMENPESAENFCEAAVRNETAETVILLSDMRKSLMRTPGNTRRRGICFLNSTACRDTTDPTG